MSSSLPIYQKIAASRKTVVCGGGESSSTKAIANHFIEVWQSHHCDFSSILLTINARSAQG